MLRKEIQEIGTFKEETYGDCIEFKLFHKYFNKEVNYTLDFEKSKSTKFEITDEILNSLNYFIDMEEELLTILSQKGFECFDEIMSNDTDINFTNTEFDTQKENFEIENREFFQVFEPKDIWKTINLNYVSVMEQANSKNELNVYLVIHFSTVWEEEHGLTFTFKNCKFDFVE